MMRKLRKGFTIVELVIVIAVIAVLTAVLIPTFVHLSKKAKLASDSSLVANLNTALAMEASESGKDPITMHEAVQGLENQGYKLPQLVTKSEEELVYSLKENKFYLSSEVTSDFVDYWHIDKKVPATQKWSIYAFNWDVSSSTEVSGLKVGFDAGSETSITSISYTRTSTEEKAVPQTVIIRTNGEDTVLSVNAPSDTIHHFDYLDELTITAVAGASYHEHGTIRGKAVINEGHMVIEDSGEAPQIVVEAATGSVKVTANKPTVISVDDESASRTTVVANAEDIYVSGEVTVNGSKSEDVVKANLITTWDELKAFEDVEDGFAKIGQDITNAQSMEIAASHKFKLDLNGHSIQTIERSAGRHYYLLDNYGECEIFDSKNSGGEIRARGIENLGGKMIVQSGSFYSVDQNGGAAIWNDYDSDGCLKKGDLTINGGSFNVEYVGSVSESVGPGVIHSSENTKFTVNGGTFTSVNMRCYAIIADGETVINNCTVTGAHGALGIDSGSAIVNGGSFTCSEFYGCWITNDGSDTKVTINGGSFSGKYGVYSSVDDGHQDESDVAIVINGGNFTGHSGCAAIINDKNSSYRFALSVYGGTYNSDPSAYLAQGYSATQIGTVWVVR